MSAPTELREPGEPRERTGPGGRTWSTLPALCLGFFMIMVDTTIVNIAVPTLVRELGAGLAAVGWVTSAYLLTFASLLLPAGRLGDRWGPRRVFVAGLAVFTLSSLWCGLSGGIGMLIAARAVQGVGAALMTPQTMAVITRVFPAAKRGAAMGIWGAVAGVATIAGPVLGGVLVEGWGWEWIFFINVPVGVVGLVLALRTLPVLPLSPHRLDWFGALLAVAGLAAVTFGLQEGENYHWGAIWGPVTIVEILVLGLVVLAGFVVWQARTRGEPLLPLGLFRHRNFSLANVTGLAVMFAMTGMFLPLTIYLQSILGLTPLEAALLNLPMSLVAGVIAPFAGRLSDRVPPKYVIGVGLVAFLVALSWVALVIEPDTEPWHLVPLLMVFGVGIGCVFSPLANVATSGLDHRTAGAGAGAFNTTRQVGGAIGTAAIVAVLQARLAVTLPAAARDAAAGLPAGIRTRFLDGFAQVSAQATAGQGGGVALPAGIPAALARQIRAAAATAYQTGFTRAAAQSLWVIVAVLALGLLATALMTVRPAAPAGPADQSGVVHGGGVRIPR